jgi:hypothetical protein
MSLGTGYSDSVTLHTKKDTLAEAVKKRNSISYCQVLPEGHLLRKQLIIAARENYQRQLISTQNEYSAQMR